MRSEYRPLPRPGGRARSAARVPEASPGEAAAARRLGSCPRSRRGPVVASPAEACSFTWSPPAARRRGDRTAEGDGRGRGRLAPQPALAARPEEAPRRALGRPPRGPSVPPPPPRDRPPRELVPGPGALRVLSARTQVDSPKQLPPDASLLMMGDEQYYQAVKPLSSYPLPTNLPNEGVR
ncbi:uncharacterized protein J5F26_014217 isoform 1-T1 [Ciconia maguari]